MIAIRLITLTATVLLAACGTAGASTAGQAGGLAPAAETRPIGWDMLDGSAAPDTTADVIADPSSSWCFDSGNCVRRQ